MKLLITTALFLIGQMVSGQIFSYPAFKKSVKSINEIILPNWFLKDSATGDLNGDHIPDLAIIVEFKDTIDELRPDSSINTGSPRILLIFFKDLSGNFNLVLQNNTFIKRYGEGGINNTESYMELAIKNNNLEIFCQLLRGNFTYKFRYQNEDIYLIGFENVGQSSNDGDIEDYSINFLTGKIKVENDNISSDKSKIRWYSLKEKKSYKLKEMTMTDRIEIGVDKFHEIYI